MSTLCFISPYIALLYEYVVSVLGDYAAFINSQHSVGSLGSLRSPWYGSGGKRCRLSWRYVMFGTAVGEMAVYVSRENASHRVWREYGNKGAR